MYIASDDEEVVHRDAYRESHWSQRAKRRQSADTPRRATDEGATVVARESGWPKTIREWKRIRTWKMVRMETWWKEMRRGDEKGGNKRVFCLALLRADDPRVGNLSCSKLLSEPSTHASTHAMTWPSGCPSARASPHSCVPCAVCGVLSKPAGISQIPNQPSNHFALSWLLPLRLLVISPYFLTATWPHPPHATQRTFRRVSGAASALSLTPSFRMSTAAKLLSYICGMHRSVAIAVPPHLPSVTLVTSRNLSQPTNYS